MYIGRSERPRAMQAQSVVCCAAASSSSAAGPSPSSSLSQRTGSVAAGERANIGILWRGTAMTVKKDADAASAASAASAATGMDTNVLASASSSPPPSSASGSENDNIRGRRPIRQAASAPVSGRERTFETNDSRRNKVYYRHGRRISWEEKIAASKIPFPESSWEFKFIQRLNAIKPWRLESLDRFNAQRKLDEENTTNGVSTTHSDADSHADTEEDNYDFDNNSEKSKYYSEAVDAVFEEVAQGREEHMTARSVTAMLKGINRVDVALMVYRNLQKRAYSKEQVNTVYAFGNLIMKCSRLGFCDIVRDLLAEMDSLGIQPNDLTQSFAITAFIKAGNLEEAREIFHKARAQGNVGLDAYACMFVINREEGLWRQNIKLVMAMWNDGLTPESRHYDFAFKACDELGDVDESLRLLNEMEKMGVAPSTKTLTIMLQAATNAKDYQIAMVFMKRARKLGVVPNSTNYRILVVACHKATRLDLVNALLEELRASMDDLQFDWYSLQNVTQAVWAFEFGSEPVKQTMFVYNELKRRNLLHRTDERFYSAVIGALDMGNDWDAAMRVFGDAKRIGLKMNTPLYNALMSAVSKGGRKRENVVSIMREMKLAGIRPNTITYSSVLVAYEMRRNEKGEIEIEKGDCAVAMQLRSEMIRRQVRMNSVVWSQIIGILWDGGMYTESVKMVLEAEKDGVELTKQWTQGTDLFREASTTAQKEQDLTTVVDFHGVTPGCASACFCLFLLRLRRNPQACEPHVHLITGRGKHFGSSWRGITVSEAIELWMSKKKVPFVSQRLSDGYVNEGRFQCSKAELLEWIKSVDSSSVDFINAVAPTWGTKEEKEEEVPPPPPHARSS